MDDKTSPYGFGTSYPDGAVVFRENDPGEEMYVIQDGRVELSATVDGQKRVFGILERGAFFGEMALVDQMPRSATATVVGEARLMVLHRDTVRERLSSDPHTALLLLRSMCLRLRSLRSSLDELVKQDHLDPAMVDAAMRAHLSG